MCGYWGSSESILIVLVCQLQRSEAQISDRTETLQVFDYLLVNWGIGVHHQLDHPGSKGKQHLPSIMHQSVPGLRKLSH